MQTYQLLIWRHDRLLGRFETDVPWAQEAIADIQQSLSKIGGYRLEKQASIGERRIVESSPDGVRVLSTQVIYPAHTHKAVFSEELSQ